MYIDESVTANISASSGSDDCSSGVCIDSTVTGSLTINGNFSVSSIRGNVCGIYFSSAAAGSIQNIDGNFSVFDSDAAGSAYGVRFASTDAGSITINGNFSVFSASHNAYGV
jgi:hypothetical protein